MPRWHPRRDSSLRDEFGVTDGVEVKNGHEDLPLLEVVQEGSPLSPRLSMLEIGPTQVP